MANGDGVEYEFQGNPDCPICGALAGTIDTRPIPQPHENCQCSSIPRCDNQYHYSGSSTRCGPGGECFVRFPHAEFKLLRAEYLLSAGYGACQAGWIERR